MASLPPPRKKPRVHEELGNPLPVPIASLTGLPVSPAAWHYYFARYKDGVITVPDPEHAASLWHNGYFGHGRIVNTDDDCRYPQKKKWKLVQVDGLKGGSWLKDQHMDSSIPDMEVVPENNNDSQSEQEHRYTESETEPGCSKIEKEVSLKEQCDSNDSVVIINTGNRIKVLDPEIEKCSRTVLVLNSDRGESSSDGCTYESYLKLLPEEALFLSYALGCLVVTQKKTVPEKQNRKRISPASEKEKDHEMTIDQMWNSFSKADPKFPVKYAVYHHYRTKGWVVKSGLKFGADWALYPVGPPFYHSQYTIMIQCVWSDTLTRDDRLSWRELSWTNVSVTERLNNHVNKTPLICFVLRPRSLTDDKIGRVECLKQFNIQEMLLSRWNPNDNEL